jgi:DNA modification methylase
VTGVAPGRVGPGIVSIEASRVGPHPHNRDLMRRERVRPLPAPTPPAPRATGDAALQRVLDGGVIWGDSEEWLPALPEASVDLWFTSPPYADARAYGRIHPDRYVEWFLPFSKYMLAATKQTGWLVLNIKNRVANSGPAAGQRHPYVYQLVLALQHQGWRWLETYIWAKPNGVPGRFGPRTKDSFEYVYAFAKGLKPYFDLDAIRVPYRTAPDEIERRKLDRLGRRNTEAGFGRDRTKTYLRGGADPGNIVSVAQTYNQHRGAGGHTAAMPEGLAEFFVKACSPADGVVLDPFAGSGTTVVVARRLGRRAGGLEIHQDFAAAAQERVQARLGRSG